MSVGWFLDWSAGWSVCHNFLGNLRSYRSTFMNSPPLLHPLKLPLSTALINEIKLWGRQTCPRRVSQSPHSGYTIKWISNQTQPLLYNVFVMIDVTFILFFASMYTFLFKITNLKKVFTNG